jgi:choline-glycine betaine transporter
VVALFFATSSDSASLVVDMLCSGTGDPGPVRQRVFWGVSEGVLAASLIILGGTAGLTALQQVITVIGLPIFILVFAMMFALIVGLRTEAEAALLPSRPMTADKQRAAPESEPAPSGPPD